MDDALAEFARGHELALASGPGRIVDGKSHRDGGLIDANRGQRPWILEVGDRLADFDIFQTRNHHDISRLRAIDFDPLQTLPRVEMRDLAHAGGAVEVAQRVLAAVLHRARDHATDREAANVVIVIEVVGLELQRRFRIDFGAGQMTDDGLEQRLEIFAALAELRNRGSDSGIGIEDRKIELLFLRAEIDEQIVNLVEDIGGASIGAIDFVDAKYRGEPGLECLLQHEARLRERTFACVDQQQDSVDHRERALDFAAEV